MITLCVVQHTDGEYLGLLEDHLEGRAIRFAYARPHVPGGVIPATAQGHGGLVLLGAGPQGMASGNLLPSLAADAAVPAGKHCQHAACTACSTRERQRPDHEGSGA